MARGNNEAWRLHCLGWTTTEIAERLLMTPLEVRKRITAYWSLDSDGTHADGDAEEDRRIRKRDRP